MHHVIRFLMGTLEWILRKTVFNKNLEKVEKVIENISYGDDSKQVFDIIVPVGPGPFPVLFYFHGGGWISGDKSNFHWICHKFASSGMLVFNVNYRLSPENQFPEPLKDVSSAIQSGMKYAGQYGGDLSKVYIAGDSAGAHLASLFAARFCAGKQEPWQNENVQPSLVPENIKGILLFYGIYDLKTAWNINHKVVKSALKYFIGPGPDIAVMQDASPAKHVSAKLPPFFLCAGEPDILFDQTKDFAKILTEAGIECKALLFSREQNPESNHSFINFGTRNCSQIAVGEAILFIAGHKVSVPDETDL